MMGDVIFGLRDYSSLLSPFYHFHTVGGQLTIGLYAVLFKTFLDAATRETVNKSLADAGIRSCAGL